MSAWSALRVSLLLLASACVGSPPPPPGQGGDSSSTTASASSSSGDPDDGTTAVASSTTDGSSSSEGSRGSSSTGEPLPGACEHRCEADADCGIAGVDAGLVCVDQQCRAAAPCQGDGACVVEVSGWAMGAPCMGGFDCTAMGIDAQCIGVSGQGRCVPSPAGMGCSDPAFEILQVVNVDGDRVSVCGQTDAYCGADGLCAVGCSNDFDCVDTVLPACDTDSGRCGCLDDADCAAAGVPGAHACLMGTCGCLDDQGCQDAGAGDVCVDGECRCHDDTTCVLSGPFDGGGYVCAPP